ncbi:hypothetical protein B0H14DRAFT_3892039 [Mycena olivaceomarginata]|nr:hypothetical protein B0H14DRAFT_3892039 [Mycena olivaceomarginata]
MRGRRPLLLLLARKMLLRGRDRVLPQQMRLPMSVWLRGLLGLSLRYLGLGGRASASAAHNAAAPAAVGRRATAEAASHSAATPPRSTATAGPSVGAAVPSLAVAGAAARQADATPASAGAADIYSNPNSPARGPKHQAQFAPSQHSSLFLPTQLKTQHARAVPTQRHRALPLDYRYPPKYLKALYKPSPPLRWRSPVPSTQVPSDDLGRIAGYRLSARAHARALQKSVIDVRRPNLGLKLGPTRPWASRPNTRHNGDVPLPHQPPSGRKKVGRRVDPRSLHGRCMRRPPLFSAYWRAALLMSASVGAYASAARAPLLSTLLSTHSLAPSLPAIPVHPSPLERDVPLHTSSTSSFVPSSLGPRALCLPEPPSFPASISYPFDLTDSYAYVCPTYRTYSASAINTIPSL